MRRLFLNVVKKNRYDLDLLEGFSIIFFSIPFLLLIIPIDLLCGHVYDHIMLYGGRSKTMGAAILWPIIIRIIYFLIILKGLSLLVRHILNLFRPKGNNDRNIIFIDETKDPVFLNLFFEKTTSFLYLFFRDPYIYRMKFLVDTYTDESYSCFRQPIYFNLPPHKTYDNEIDNLSYEIRYKEDTRKTDLKRSKHFRYTSKSYLNKYNGKDYHQYTYYITYQKAQALNRLFEIVKLPAFRIVVSEERHFLHEIHPIEGREYPEEAYELMEKINQMYP